MDYLNKSKGFPQFVLVCKTHACRVRHMASITFRADDELVGLLEKGEAETGLNESELCRVALAELLSKQPPHKIQQAHNLRRIKLNKRRKAA